MYQLSWMTDGNVDHWDVYDHLKDVVAAINDLKSSDDVVSWTVGLVFDGSDPQYFDYDDMTHRQKGEHVMTLIDMLPEHFDALEVAATIMSIADAYVDGHENMAMLFDSMAETCRTTHERGEATLQ